MHVLNASQSALGEGCIIDSRRSEAAALFATCSFACCEKEKGDMYVCMCLVAQHPSLCDPESRFWKHRRFSLMAQEEKTAGMVHKRVFDYNGSQMMFH